MLIRVKNLLIIICLLSLLRHFYVLPNIDWENHEITGMEFKIRWWIK